MPCKRGDVVLVLYPNTDLRTAKKRPALVIQSDNMTKKYFERNIGMTFD